MPAKSSYQLAVEHAVVVPQRPAVLVSACLLGQAVRYDGGHKRDPYLEILKDYLELRSVCPEMAIGLGVPRPPIHLVTSEAGLKLVEVKGVRQDYTQAMDSFARTYLAGVNDIDGCIVKKNSPSCGLSRVPVYDQQGRLCHKQGRGAFTQRLIEALPQLPVEEEGRLNDPALRENFLQRVFVHFRWRRLLAEGPTPARLVDFHTRHKYMVMAHSVSAYQRLGRLLAKAGEEAIEPLAQVYFSQLMAALKQPARRPNHVNVLQHLAGYLSRELSLEDRCELTQAIEAYCRGEVPLIVPMTLLRHHQNRIRQPYLERQYYLEPYPPALGLRNAI